jgi:RNA polymerase sigma-70 factor (ECF subfamily)
MLGQVARAYTRSDADRADLESEMVAQLWRAYPRYDAARSFSTWMYRIALNVAISFGRRYRVAVPLEEAGGALAIEPRAHEDRDERLQRLNAFIAALDPMSRALVLLYLEDCPQREIAEVLGITETNVSTKLHRLKRRLREQMTEAEGE